jgi:hypothetical protein
LDGRIDGGVVGGGVVVKEVLGGWSSIGIWRGVGRGVMIMLVTPVRQYPRLRGVGFTSGFSVFSWALR